MKSSPAESLRVLVVDDDAQMLRTLTGHSARQWLFADAGRRAGWTRCGWRRTR